MTPDERLEAAARAWLEHCDSVLPTSLPGRWEDVAAMLRNAYLGRAKTALAAAYPELTAGTHWLAPMEMTKGMVKAVYDKFAALNVVYPEDAWSAARDAYLKEGGNGG